MFRKLALLLSLIFAVSLASPVVAQTPEVSPEDLEGLQSMALRVYMQPEENLTAALNEGESLPPIAALTGAFTFDSEENAGNALDAVTEGIANEIVGSLGVSLDEAPAGEAVENLGDKAELREVSVEESGLEMNVSLLTVQEGEMVYLFVTVVVGSGQEQFVMDLAEHVLDAGVSDTEVEFDESGTSTGGAFDAFPTEEDEDLLQGMQIESDMYEMDPALATPES